MIDGRLNRTRSLPTTGLALLAGLAVGLGSVQRADAISFVKLRTNHDAWETVAVPARDMEGNIIWTDLDGDGFRDREETETVFQAITGAGVTVGMIEPAHPLINVRPNDPNAPFEHHIAFNGIDHRRIWYPFEGMDSGEVSTVRREIAPRDEQGFLLFPTSHHQHATAVAGAIAARNNALQGDITSIGPVTGIAPNVQLLSGALLTSSDPEDPTLGTNEGLTVEAFLFTLAAMTDLDFTGDGQGDYIEPLAEWYGVEPWQPASVINISFGRARTIEQRAGEDVFARLCDIIARKTNTLIIAAAGDEGENGMLDDEENEAGRVASPAAAHNVIAVGRTGSGDDSDSVADESSFGPQVRYNWIHKDLDGNFYLEVPGGSEGEDNDYSDINFLDDMDPRDPPDQTLQLFPDNNNENPDGVRPGIDIVAPGTLIELPGNLTLPQGQLGLATTWTGFEGTSFASAIVTGAVALMQEYGDAWEYSTDPLVLRAVLLNSADKPDRWDNDSTPDPVNNFSTSTPQGLDGEFGAGVLDFERLFLQYRTTAGGYPDLGPAKQEVIRNSIFPLFRRDPNIEEPNAGEFGTVGFMPVAAPLRSEGRYFETFISGSGADVPRAYLYTDPEFAMVTFYDDPTAATMMAIAPPTDNTSPTDDASPTLTPDDGGGFRSYSAQPIAGDRYDFGSVGGGNSNSGRVGGIGGPGGRTGTTGTGDGVGPRPGGGGDGGGIDGGNSSGALRPCTSPVESRCVRTGWDIGRVGVGTILLPIGGLPQGSDVTATLVWHRIEEIDDSVYEELLDGVITATPPAPPSLPVIEGPESFADLDASDPELRQELNNYGPAVEPRYARQATTWPSQQANYTTYPLIMAGETHLGPGPAFQDLDFDRDGVIDFLGGVRVDNCLITEVPHPTDPDLDPIPVPFNQFRIPLAEENDSFNPAQVDADTDGCGPPCDTDDAAPGPPDQDFCAVSGLGTLDNVTDSERLRRVVTNNTNTAVDTLNIDPKALSGVVALRFNRGGQTEMATGVVISQQRLITAAHVFDQNNDGVDDGDSVTVFFPTMSGNPNTATLGITGSSFPLVSGPGRAQIHPSFNYLGDRIADGGNDPNNVELNGADDIAVVTFSPAGTIESFSDFIDLVNGNVPGTFPYTGAELQVYDIFEGTPPDLGDTQEIIIAGYGESGDGRYGVPADSSTGTPPPGFVPLDFDLPIIAPLLPVMRAGKNVIEFYPFDNDDDNIGDDTAPREQYGFNFDEPTSGASLGNRIESMITFGDSGGPAFIHNDINMDGNVDLGELQLFGINTRMNVPAGATELSTFGSRGLGMILGAYTGVDGEGNDRFITAVLNNAPPQIPQTIGFGQNRAAHFDLTTAFKFDNLSLALFRDVSVGGSGFAPIPTATSSSINNVEHIYAQNIAQGQYYISITWDGPVFDWSGFIGEGPTPFRKVPPIMVPGPGNSNDGLDVEELVDFYPAEVKYGLAWWADLPYDRLFEITFAGARTSGQLHGDLNGDMYVDSADLAMLLSQWGKDDWHCDINDSGVVDMGDLATLLQNYTSR